MYMYDVLFQTNPPPTNQITWPDIPTCKKTTRYTHMYNYICRDNNIVIKFYTYNNNCGFMIIFLVDCHIYIQLSGKL